jgi:hypothetical protein
MHKVGLPCANVEGDVSATHLALTGSYVRSVIRSVQRKDMPCQGCLTHAVEIDGLILQWFIVSVSFKTYQGLCTNVKLY